MIWGAEVSRRPFVEEMNAKIRSSRQLFDPDGRGGLKVLNKKGTYTLDTVCRRS